MKLALKKGALVAVNRLKADQLKRVHERVENPHQVIQEEVVAQEKEVERKPTFLKEREKENKLNEY